jgi:hypothetical protein
MSAWKHPLFLIAQQARAQSKVVSWPAGGIGVRLVFNSVDLRDTGSNSFWQKCVSPG